MRLQIKSEQDKVDEVYFSKNEITRDIIKLEAKETISSGCFKYLNSIFQSSGDIQQDVNHKIMWVEKIESDYWNIM